MWFVKKIILDEFILRDFNGGVGNQACKVFTDEETELHVIPLTVWPNLILLQRRDNFNELQLQILF